MAVDPIRGADDPQQRVVGALAQTLFEAHARMVYGLCRALLRDPHDAEDATQSTFVSAYRWLQRGGDVRDPAAWLATIARNECATRARARMREPLPLLESDIGLSPEPQAELERRAVVEGLQEAIAGLPDRQREAVVLRDLYGLPYAEVGAALGLSVASVESLLFRARRTLRTRLRPLGGAALTVPLGVREALAQVLPGFSTSTTAGGGAASGAVGLGLLSKLAGGPAAVKATAGLAAAIAAGSIAVVGVERRSPAQHVQGGEKVARASGPNVARSEAAPVAAAPPGTTVALQPVASVTGTSAPRTDRDAPAGHELDLADTPAAGSIDHDQASTAGAADASARSGSSDDPGGSGSHGATTGSDDRDASEPEGSEHLLEVETPEQPEVSEEEASETGSSHEDRGGGTESPSGSDRGEVARSRDVSGSGDEGTEDVSAADGHGSEDRSSDADNGSSGLPPA